MLTEAERVILQRRQDVYAATRLSHYLIHGGVSHWCRGGAIRIQLESIAARDGAGVAGSLGIGTGYHRLLTHRGLSVKQAKKTGSWATIATQTEPEKMT